MLKPMNLKTKVQHCLMKAKYRSWRFIERVRAPLPRPSAAEAQIFLAAINRRRPCADASKFGLTVDGILTTDPRICPDARRIKVIGFDEAARTGLFRAKVLHPGQRFCPPSRKISRLYVLNSFKSVL